jgi:lipopolysaccharide/colanic/teichoic acid biosynthesis glycosyltransferase
VSRSADPNPPKPPGKPGTPSPLHRPVSQRIKRCIDVALVSVGGCVLLPLLLFIAATIRWSSSGNVLFAQERIGRGGAPFRMWKFRTMRHDAELLLDEFLREDPELQQQWRLGGKLPNDPRVIPWIGKFLRRSSLDELPQLWNVLKGEMSLVGPRPLPQYHVNQFDRSFLERRHAVTPGMTGMWQITSRGNGSPEMFVKWDTYYLDSWSLGLDFTILMRTAVTVVSGDGAT